jgi:hypothetical protein
VIGDCDCDTTPFGNHAPDCYVVTLRRRPRVDCAKCECDDVPAARSQEFRDMDYCYACEDNYDGAPMHSGDNDGPGWSEIMAEARGWHLKAIMGSFQPKHEHKTAGVAYLMSLWFEAVQS